VLAVLHGFNDYSHFFEAAGSFLQERGIASYAYDQRGFGGSPGWGLWFGEETYARDAADFVLALRKLHPHTPIYLLGESMGGAVAILSTTGANPPPLQGLILVAPAVWGRETMPWYQTALLSLLSNTLPALRLTGQGLGYRPSDNLEVLRGLGRDPMVIKATRVDAMAGLTDLMDSALHRAAQIRLPTLVLYGDQDQIIPREPVLRMLHSMTQTPLRTAFYAQGYHLLLRDLHRELPSGDIAGWIENPAAPLRSGAAELAVKM
jgi:alpha-beta hydrolase superfamily lysophospholipase